MTSKATIAKAIGGSTRDRHISVVGTFELPVMRPQGSYVVHDVVLIDERMSISSTLHRIMVFDNLGRLHSSRTFGLARDGIRAFSRLVAGWASHMNGRYVDRLTEEQFALLITGELDLRDSSHATPKTS